MQLRSLLDMEADLWVFDNDGTLYENPKEIEIAVVRLMIRFIAKRYNIDIEKASEKRKALLVKHNTKYTLVAIKQEGFNENDFLKETYLAIKPEEFNLVPSDRLRKLIFSLPGEKTILTNNPSSFARLVLESLNVIDLFSAIYGMQEIGYIQKPDERAFKIIRKNTKRGKKVIFVDDELDNIITAKKFGCVTVLIDNKGYGKAHPDFWMPKLN